MPRARRILQAAVACCCGLMLVNGSAWADIMVLLDGSLLQGTIADRDQFAADPHVRDRVAILLDGTDIQAAELRRVPVDTIDHVILEDGDHQRVFDMQAGSSSRQAPPPPPTSTRKRFPGTEEPLPPPTGEPSSSRLDTAAGLIVGGILTLGIGALVPFGQPSPQPNWYSGPDSESQYTQANYILMGAGGLLTLSGLVMLASEPSEDPPVPQHAALRVDWRGTTGPCLAYRVGF